MTKKFIVTGASRGIGKAITESLIEKGYTVIGLSRTVTKPTKQFIPYKLDLSDLNSLPEKLKQLTQAHPDIDGLICCSGRGKFGGLEEFSFKEIRSLIDLNFLSQVYLIKTYLSHFKKQMSGQLILIGSEAALNGKRKGSIYCASKFALRGFAQALRDECATNNIRVTIINPGMVNTSFFDELSFKPGNQKDEHILPQDIADAVSMVIDSREGTVFDEINLSPQKFKLEKKFNSI